ncbi:MAG: GAF domain-containing protein [Nitrospirae bacterium]|nr:GAF domain-containing protein [Nitrospirota bacterium]MBI5695868.1 GAF domain-containing protein [Nitrospirota bacterium]
MDQVMENVVETGTARKDGIARKVAAAMERLRFALLAIYVVPLLVLGYLYMVYIYPMFTANGKEVMALGISAVITFAVVLSILGLALITKSARESVNSLSGMNRRMDSLLLVTKRFEEAGYVDILVDSVARSAKEILDSEASSLLLYDDAGDLRFEYVEGPAAEFLKGRALKLGEGITGWAAKEGRPIIINDVQGDPRFAKQFDKKSGFQTKSMLCVPLRFAGYNLGVIVVLNKLSGDGYDEQDKQVLVALADHASASIYRNKTQEKMKSDFVHVMDIVLTALENYMPEKKGHSRRVAKYSVKLAKELGLDDDEVRKVYFGALLHDVGMLKFGRQEYEDLQKYKLHPVVGSEMVKNIAQWKDVAVIIRDHHERPDGGGYPAGLSGEEISLGGRIVALAEAFDVMTSKQSYKPAKGFDEAFEEIRGLSGFQFDPRVAGAFVRSFKEEDVTEE